MAVSSGAFHSHPRDLIRYLRRDIALRTPVPEPARRCTTTYSSLFSLRPRWTLHPKKTLFAATKILSPCLISLLEYHVRKNFPFSVRYVPFSVKNWVFLGVSLYSPASSGNSHSGWPTFAAAALKSASRMHYILKWSK